MKDQMSDTKLNIETRRYKLRGLTPILGGQPADPAVRTQYISSRAPSPALGAEEDELLGGIEEKGLTVFMRDEDNRLLLMDYMIKGFFKSALGAIKAQVDVAQERAKVDKFLFIAPRRIPLRRNGAYITDEDDQLERPLRAPLVASRNARERRAAACGVASHRRVPHAGAGRLEARLAVREPGESVR